MNEWNQMKMLRKTLKESLTEEREDSYEKSFGIKLSS